MRLLYSFLTILFFSLSVKITVNAQATECGNNKQSTMDHPGDDCVKAGDPFDPYTGNESRQVKDLEIWGGVGETALEWVRYGNSRNGDFYQRFGFAHNWNHSYQYTMMDDGTDMLGNRQIFIHYPEGGGNDFIQSSADPSLWLADHGIDKRLFMDGIHFYLQMANGYRYHFEKVTDATGDYYRLQDFRDPFQNLYAISYDGFRRMVKITEPAGRFLQITYAILEGHNVITQVATNDGRTVKYTYDIFDDGMVRWARLTTVTYGDGTKATYKYSQSQPGMRPLLEHAIDPRLSGVNVNMRYVYDETIAQGYISKELNGKTGEVMTTLTPVDQNRNVCYSNGRIQTFFMPLVQQGYLNTYTDGLGRSTKYAYANGAVGFEQSETDALGRTTVFNQMSIYGNPLEITHPDGTKEKWTRDDLDLVLSHTDELGRITVFTRDSKHRVTRIGYPDGTSETFTYNAFGQVLDHQRRNKGIEHSAYSNNGLRTSFTDAAGNITRYAYDQAGRRITVIDALNHTTGYRYTERGLLDSVINADGSVKTYAYDEFGNRTMVTDELKHTWKTLYDEFKRPVSETDPLNRVTRYSYDLPGGICGCTHDNNTPTRITLPSGRKTEIEYDVEWEKIKETVAAGTPDAATTFYEYDLVGNLVSVVDPKGKAWTTTFDSRNRKISSTDPLGNKTQWTYDAVGNTVKITRPDNGTTLNTYDVMNRLTTSIDPKKQITTMKYDAEGNPVDLADPNANHYRFEYDILNRKTKMIYPGGSHEDYSYDAVSNLNAYTNRAGAVRSYKYDSRNREIFCSWNDGITPSITRGYDAGGKLILLSSNVSVLRYNYNKANELLNEIQTVAGGTGPKTVRYNYNMDGLKSLMVYPGGQVLNYRYSSRNQLVNMFTTPGSLIVSYTYDLNGNRLTKTLENGTATNYTYDDANRMLSVDNKKGTASFARFDYGYDNVNRRKFMQKDKGKGDVYSYDAIDQVTKVLYNATDPAGAATNAERIVQYDWDSAGNRKNVAENGIAAIYTTNTLNQYTKVNGNALSYDLNGNLKTFNKWIYTYDAQNRLIKATDGITTATFSYDPRNRCVKRVINGTILLSYYDDWNLVEERNGNDALMARYTHGSQIDEIIKRATATDSVYYHHDALGSVVRLTNRTGNVVEQYTYDIFGNPDIRNGSGVVVSNSAFGNRFMFTGREYIQELQLYDYRNRMYSGGLGRFLQNDPLRFKSGNNLYRFVSNNPIDNLDPRGLCANKKSNQEWRQNPDGSWTRTFKTPGGGWKTETWHSDGSHSSQQWYANGTTTFAYSSADKSYYYSSYQGANGAFSGYERTGKDYRSFQANEGEFPSDNPLERAKEYANSQRGKSGDDSQHHGIAVREFGKNIESGYGSTAGTIATIGAALTGNFIELFDGGLNLGDAARDADANIGGIFYYWNDTIFTFEK